MQTHSFPTAFARALSVGALLVGFLPGIRAESGVEFKVTVGVFSRAPVVEAYYRSAAWKARMQAKIQEGNQAAVAGDGTKADQIDREINAMQALAQKQLTGEAPLKNILDLLSADWPAIAKEAGVDMIVETPLYQAMGARVVDVTPAIVKRLQAKQAP
ncbi:MAG TPA: hypothetical protein VLW52_05530 [Opitutaceae bacterium]|nr:hypothetical protein [Opitutaceae bacterium]